MFANGTAIDRAMRAAVVDAIWSTSAGALRSPNGRSKSIEWSGRRQTKSPISSKREARQQAPRFVGVSGRQGARRQVDVSAAPRHARPNPHSGSASGVIADPPSD